MPTKSLLDEPRGKQTPRVSWIPDVPRDYTAGEDALAAADIAGRESMPWQELVVREGMATGVDGRWVAYEVCVLVARQNGKNGSIEVVELGWLVNEPGISILHTAHEFQTALESMDKLETLIRSHPLLENEIASVRRGNGKESIRLRNGCKIHPKPGVPKPEKAPDEKCRCSTIRFRTRTKSGGRGFSVDRLVIDEAMIWSPASQAAIMPLLTTAKNPQIWYLGSAADEETHEYCHKWASLRARAEEGKSNRLIWLEWSAPDPPEDPYERDRWREDVDNWAAANPSLDYIVTEAFIADELDSFRKNLEKWEVERLSTGRWPKDVATAEVIPAEKWRNMAVEEPRLLGPYAIALDRSPDRQVWVLTAARRMSDGRIFLEVGYSQAASNADVTEYIISAITEFDPVALAIDQKSAAAVIEQDLIAAGIEPTLTNTNQFAIACGGFLDDALDGRLAHGNQRVLNAAVAAATERKLPGGDFVWDKKIASASIAQLVSATLARWALLEFGNVQQKPPPPMSDTASSGPELDDTSIDDEFDALSAAF